MLYTMSSCHSAEAMLQEPSPFSHVSGMKNRFECLIQGLRAAGDDVMVFTPDRNPPRKYFGAKARAPPVYAVSPPCACCT